MVTDDINRQISRAQSTAKRKMNRIKATQRYDIAATKNNPLSGTPLNEMSRAMKVSYLKRLQKFNDKGTQFHISARGSVLSASNWKKYKAAEAKANAMVKADIDKYSKLPLPAPESGTLGERLREFRPAYARLGHDNPSGTAMHELDRSPSAFRDETSLKRLTEAELNKASRGYIGRKLTQGRDQFRKMVEAIGDQDLLTAGEELTDEQFHVLWNYTNFANSVALDYSVYMQSLIEEQPYHAGAMEKSNRRAHEWIKWASEVV